MKIVWKTRTYSHTEGPIVNWRFLVLGCLVYYYIDDGNDKKKQEVTERDARENRGRNDEDNVRASPWG